MRRKNSLWILFTLLPLLSQSQNTTYNNNVDPLGLGLSVIAMAVVFLVLMMLYLVFKNFSGIFIRAEKKKTATEITTRNTDAPSDEEMAAIVLAIHLYVIELQEHEDLTLTIKKVSRTYSPWNSKIYGVGVLNKN